MMAWVVPRVSEADKPRAAAAVKLRVAHLQRLNPGLKITDIITSSGLSYGTFYEIINGRVRKQKTLEKLISLLNHNPADEKDRPFAQGTLQELLHWYKDNKDILENQERQAQQQELTRKTLTDQQKKQEHGRIGKLMEDRRLALDGTLEDVGEQVGMTNERVRQIEAGQFGLETTVAPIILALGYPKGTVQSLENDTPIEPAWANEKREKKSAEIAENATRRKQIAIAVQSLREQQRLTRNELQAKANCSTVQHIVDGGSYSDEVLQSVIKALGIASGKEEDLLKAYKKSCRNNGGEHLMDRAKNMRALPYAIRAIRTYFDLTADDLSEIIPARLQVKGVTVLHREAQIQDNKFALDETLLGVISGLYNASQSLPRAKQLFANDPNIQAVARIANNPEMPIRFNKVFVEKLDLAVEEIVHAARAIEDQLSEITEQPLGRRGLRLGVHHARNIVKPADNGDDPIKR